MLRHARPGARADASRVLGRPGRLSRQADRLVVPAPGDQLPVRVVVLICRRYPVRAECLEEALRVEAGGYVFGVRGGTAAEERRTLLR